MVSTYSQARKDHEYLWETYGPANDMTGGYVDQDDLEKLLKSPTKSTARDCYVNQISYWFEIGPDPVPGDRQRPRDHARDDPIVEEIQERYDLDFNW